MKNLCRAMMIVMGMVFIRVCSMEFTPTAIAGRAFAFVLATIVVYTALDT